MRELTIHTVVHPQYLEDGLFLLIEHPGLKPLEDYDDRYAIYENLQTQQFVLFRLQHDNIYRPEATLPPGRFLNEATINALITRLIDHDTRRGFDPYLDIVKAQEAHVQAQKSERRAWIEEVGDKLHWGLSRSYLPGVDITRPRLVPKRV